jgi:hypothetical protein
MTTRLITNDCQVIDKTTRFITNDCWVIYKQVPTKSEQKIFW